MTQPNLKELAKQGDPQAIATLFNQVLKPKGLTTTANRIDDVLSLIVEADPLPNRDAIATLIHKGLTKLEVRSIRKVKLFGKQTGQETSAWEREFALDIPEDETLEPLPERLQEPPKLDLSIESEELEFQEAQSAKDGIHEVGDVVRDRYRIVEPIGQGSNGITYKAEDLQTSELVAIKALSLRNMGDWKQIELFEREAKILEQLNHPAIPRYLDYFQIDTPEDRAFYIVQQLAEGQNLAKLVENGWRTNEKGVRKIAIQILEILTYLHDLKPPVIHRDIKPHNLIYGNEGKIFLVDFGAVQDTYRSTMARGSTVVGTFGYMAPEQFQGQSVPATDLYALGATLLFLLTHRSPAELPQERLRYSFRSKVQISDEFANWLQKIVEPDLEDRFHSAKEALGVLRGQIAISSKLRKPLSWKFLVGVGVAVAIVGVLNSYKWMFLGKLFDISPGIDSICVNRSSLEVRQQLLKDYIKNNGYFTNIHTPCVYGIADIEILELLDSRNTGLDPKQALLYLRSHEAKMWLMKKGTDGNNNGKTSGNTSTYVPKSIEKEADVNAKDYEGKTPLHKATSVDDAKLLIENGADVNAKDGNGRTPLHTIESIEIAKLLIDKGADINAKDNNGMTPLYVTTYAARLASKPKDIAEFEDFAKLLIDKGADVNTKDNKGWTPLHVTTSVEIAKLLIQKGADINAKSNLGTTPLHAIANVRNIEPTSIEITKLLIDKGADVNAKNNKGWTPLDLALQLRHTELVQLLKQKGPATKR